MTYIPFLSNEHQREPFTSSRGKHRISEEDARAELEEEEEQEEKDKDEKKMRGRCLFKDDEMYPDEENGNDDKHHYESESETTSHTIGRSKASSCALENVEGTGSRETSSHTLGWPDILRCTFGRSSGVGSDSGQCGSDGGETEEEVSEVEGDLFRSSYEEGSK